MREDAREAERLRHVKTVLGSRNPMAAINAEVKTYDGSFRARVRETISREGEAALDAVHARCQTDRREENPSAMQGIMTALKLINAAELSYVNEAVGVRIRFLKSGK